MVRILLDEGVPDIIQKRLRHLSIATVQELGWRGFRNGDLLDLMAGEFQVLVTTDKNLSFQQNLARRELSVIVIPSNRIRILKSLMAQIEIAINTVSRGEVIKVVAN